MQSKKLEVNLMEVIRFTFMEGAWVLLAKEDEMCTYKPSFVKESYWENRVTCLVVDQHSKMACEKMQDYHIKDLNDKRHYTYQEGKIMEYW